MILISVLITKMEINQSQILDYLKGKYLTPSKSPINDVSGEKDSDTTIGEESDYSGEEAENKFLLDKLQNIENELSKWLSVLKNKIKN